VRRFGWTRLTCLFLVLTVLAALVRIGGGVEARSLAARVPDALVVASDTPEPTFTRLTEDEFAALEDMRGDPRPTEDLPPPTAQPAAKPPLSPEPVGVETARPPAEEVARVAPAEKPPVFYRPAGPGAVADSGPVCGDLRGAPKGGRIVFPLERQFFYSYEDTWGAPRTQGGHEGTDLMTPSGVPEYAITDGTVVPVAGSDANGWNSLGGNAVMIRANYSIGPVRAGDLFYYAHLEEKSPLEIGDRVNAGQVVGHAGDTGQGPPDTSGLFPPHLHLGWYDGTGGREEAGSGAMNPYPLLEWIKSAGGAVTGATDARFCEAIRPGPPVPSSGATWPTPSNPGLTPDLDTHSGNPSPVKAAAGDRDGISPAKKPVRPSQPQRPPQKPARPNEAQTPPRPTPPQQNPPEPNPPPTSPQNPVGPSSGQYGDATGEPAGQAGGPPQRETPSPPPTNAPPTNPDNRTPGAGAFRETPPQESARNDG
jgi:murein DD-endopeptidase MepM/ murein hydrolase activator NlpD